MYTFGHDIDTAETGRCPGAAGWRARSCKRFQPSAMAGLMLLAAVTTAAAGAPVMLAPHRAVYEMTLSVVSDGSTTANGKGRMVYEFRGAECLGYSISMRWVAEWGDDSGEAAVEDLRYASFEDGAGVSFTFTSTRYRDQELIEEMQASAETGRDGGDGEILLKKPEPATAALPAGTIFPTAHMKKVIARALAGQTTATDRVYDVSEDGKAVYNTFTLVAPLGEKERRRGVGAAPELKALPAWNTTVGYFLGGTGGESLPEYEQTFSLFANGVATRMRLSTASILIDAELGQIEFLKPSKC
jgi:hypothetical protein